MVYYSGSKMARNAASITNRPNCGGTGKKAGLSKTIGLYTSSNPNLIGGVNTQFGNICIGNFSNPSQSALRAIRRY
jgi:hypothetical protein